MSDGFDISISTLTLNLLQVCESEFLGTGSVTSSLLISFAGFYQNVCLLARGLDDGPGLVDNVELDGANLLHRKLHAEFGLPPRLEENAARLGGLGPEGGIEGIDFLPAGCGLGPARSILHHGAKWPLESG